MMTTDIDVANLTTLLFEDLYTTEGPRRWLVNTVGITTKRTRGKIIKNRFDNLKAILNMYSISYIDIFVKYLNNLDKTYATAEVTMCVYYSSIVIARFTACVFDYT